MSDERLENADEDLQRWIDGLLCSAVEQTNVSQALRCRVQQSLSRKRRQRTLTACGLAAAASLVIALQWAPVSSDRQVVSKPTTVAPPALLIHHTPIATFIATGDLITIPIESGDPTVTIVQVYPSMLTYQLRRRKAAFAPILSRTDTKPTHSIRGG